MQAAHAIYRGEVPETNLDFVLLSVDSADAARDRIVRIAHVFHEKGADFQVLSPRHGGGAGVTRLNEVLRTLLNPPAPTKMEVKVSGNVIREGDRIVIVKNDYKLGVCNGDVGYITHIDAGSKTVGFMVEGSPAVHASVSFRQAARILRLAYAVTVHRSQGMEYDYIVMPMLPEFSRQLYRNLLYTAVTRARRKVILVGDKKALRRAVINDQAIQRNTTLAHRIQAVLRRRPPSDVGIPDAPAKDAALGAKGGVA